MLWRWVRVCPQCQRRRAEQREAEETAKETRRRREMLKACGVSERVGKGFDDLLEVGDQRARDAARSLLRREAYGLYLWGPTGCGKTAPLEALVTSWIMTTGRGAVFLRLGEIKRAMVGDFNARDRFIRRLEQAPLLVIDNLEGVKFGQGGEGLVQELIMGRYARRGPGCVTAFSSIFPPSRQARDLGRPALESRWMSWGPVVGMKGIDLRGVLDG